MPLQHNQVTIFRSLFFITLIIISYLTTASLSGTIVGDINDKFSHFLAFFTLAFLIDFSFPKKDFGYLKFFELFSYGLLIEIIQYTIPYRSFSLYDLLANGTGLLAYKFAIPLIRQLYFLNSRWVSNS